MYAHFTTYLTLHTSTLTVLLWRGLVSLKSNPNETINFLKSNRNGTWRKAYYTKQLNNFFHVREKLEKNTVHVSNNKILSQVKKTKEYRTFSHATKIYFTVPTLGHIYLTLYIDANKKD
jgi:hypothetical protein